MRRIGRLELALGSAWFEKEHRGARHPSRRPASSFDLLEDTLEILTPALHRRRRRPTTARVSLHDAALRPRPVQLPHPPIWVGGTGPTRTLPLAARYADVWHAFGTPNSLRELEAPGSMPWPRRPRRDPASIMRAGSLSLDDLETARKHAGKWRDAGFGYLVCGWPDAGEPQVDAFVRDVLPEFAAG